MHDIWFVETDNSGNMVNSFAIGSAENDYPYAFVKSNAGYVVLSKIGAKTSDFDTPAIWIFEIGSNKQIAWKTFIPGLNAGKLIKTKDDGYLTDLFATKFNNKGMVQWEKSFVLPDQDLPQTLFKPEMNTSYWALRNQQEIDRARVVLTLQNSIKWATSFNSEPLVQAKFQPVIYSK